MTVLDVLAIAYWPVVVGSALVGWRFRSDPNALGTGWGLAALVALAGFVYVLIADIPSLWVLLDVYVGTILFGALCVWVTYLKWREFPLASRAGMGLLGVALIGFACTHLIGDYLLPRQVVQGTVQRLDTHGHMGPSEYAVRIDGRSYMATTRTYSMLRVGDRVRAEIGQGSGYIYRLERMP